MKKWKEYNRNIGIIENMIKVPNIYDELPDVLKNTRDITDHIRMRGYPKKIRYVVKRAINESIEIMKVDWDFRSYKDGEYVPFFPKPKSDFRDILDNLSPLIIGNMIPNYYKTPASVKGLLETIRSINESESIFKNYYHSDRTR